MRTPSRAQYEARQCLNCITRQVHRTTSVLLVASQMQASLNNSKMQAQADHRILQTQGTSAAW